MSSVVLLFKSGLAADLTFGVGRIDRLFDAATACVADVASTCAASADANACACVSAAGTVPIGLADTGL